jgi:Ca2+-binding EF-hand superfamily protein
MKDFAIEDVELLTKRYSTSSGDVHFMTLDKDLADIAYDQASGQAGYRSGQGVSGTTHDADAELAAALGWTSQMPASMTAPPWSAGGRRITLLNDNVTGKQILEKVRRHVQERSLRLHDSFQDFDKLRRGLCKMHHVKTVLTVVRVELEENELEALRQMYTNAEGLFRYKDFASDVYNHEALMPPAPGSAADTQVAKTPLASPGMGMTARRPQDGGVATPRQRTVLGAAADASLDELEVWIRKRVLLRNLPLKNAFQDFDRVRSGRVTRTQFSRIMNMLNVQLSEKQVDLIAEAYCDRTKMWEFKYLDFCAAFDNKFEMNNTAVGFQRPSKYFSRAGQVMAHPLSARGGAGGDFGMRPCTR